MKTTYIRYSQVRPGDRVKLIDGFIWRDRRTAEKYDAQFLTVAALEPSRYSDRVTLVTDTGERFDKPKTSKALVDAASLSAEHDAALDAHDAERRRSG
jgi:hypothetical protein